MHTRILGLGLIGALSLTACSGGLLGGPQSGPDVSGKLNGNWPNGTTKIALIGVNEQGAYGNGSQAQIVDTNITDGFTYDLPKTADQGLYRIIAYVDGSNGNAADGSYQLGETVSDDNGKYLVYSNQAFTVFGKTFGAGWSVFNKADGTVTPSGAASNDTFSGYDLNYPANP